MNRGSYDLGHYIIYILIAIIIIAAQISTIQRLTSQNILIVHGQKQLAQEYLFSRAIVSCMSFQDDAGLIHEGKISPQQFTDERLRSCTSEPTALILLEKDTPGVRVVSTDPSLQFYISLRFLYHQTVLVDGKP